MKKNIEAPLACKYHWAVPDYMQRAAKHLVSKVDYEQAAAVGKKGVEFALEGERSIMVTIERISSSPYKWEVGKVPLHLVANQQKNLPDEFCQPSKYSLNEAARNYYLPLIQGEVYPEYSEGLVRPASLAKKLVAQKLPQFNLMKKSLISSI